MSAPKVMTGARAKFAILDPAAGTVEVMGIFMNVSYGLAFDVQPAYILGRYSPAELDYTGQEPISITATGWRVVGHGAHRDGKVPNLRDLLRHEYITLVILDRQTNRRIATIHKVRPTGYSTAVNARQQEEITVTFMGILVDDEDTQNAEAPDASDLP